MGEGDDKIDVASSEHRDSDAESTSESVVGPLPEIVEPIPLTNIASNWSTRSRRPSLMRDPLEPPLQLQKSAASTLEPAVSEKWTVKRIAKATWAYVTTVKGFLITIYMLNIIAWGGMLFLLICNAAPAMCTPTCNDINSPRRVWIEIDSQILNALFCVTGIGLLPWRARDGYLLYRKNWAKLSKIHAGWYINGVTRRALMYWVVILFLANSGWQIAMACCMWTMNRITRPSWCIGLTISAGFICAIGAGGIEFWEVRRRKKLQKLGKIAPPVQVLEKNMDTGDRKLGPVEIV